MCEERSFHGVDYIVNVSIHGGPGVQQDIPSLHVDVEQVTSRERGSRPRGPRDGWQSYIWAKKRCKGSAVLIFPGGRRLRRTTMRALSPSISDLNHSRVNLREPRPLTERCGTQKEDGERWHGEFSSAYVEEVTQKTGNFKKFDTFVKMLKSSLVQVLPGDTELRLTHSVIISVTSAVPHLQPHASHFFLSEICIRPSP